MTSLRAALIAAGILTAASKPVTVEEVRHSFTAPQPVVPTAISRMETSQFLAVPLTTRLP